MPLLKFFSFIRRGSLLLAALLVLLIVASACLGPQPTPEMLAPTVTPPPSDPEIEVFTWWTAAGEVEALDALVGVFQSRYPGIDFIDAAIAGSAGENARAALAARLQDYRPPDSWQAHAGQEIAPYADAGLLEPINFLFEQYGWLAVLPPQLISLISQEGNIYSMPVGIHRANVLWYNPDLLAQNGIALPTTQAEFLAALETLKVAGMEAPLALAEPWTDTHLFETLLLAALGPKAYAGLWTGVTDWNSPDVMAAIEQFTAVLGYVNADANDLTWQQAAQRLSDGQAAFYVMGDWADGYYRSRGLTLSEDYDWTPVPGTSGVFQFLADSFVLPVGAAHRQAAIAWLTVAGSKVGQDAFNTLKGSIPARRDADRQRYGAYQQAAMSDWNTNALVGSLSHGVVATDAWRSEIEEALQQFRATGDAAVLQATLAAACRTSGPCP